MSREPQVRASISKGITEGFRRVAADGPQARWRPAGADVVEAATRLEWLSLETHMSLLEDGRQRLGDASFRRGLQVGTLASFELPPLSGLIRTAVRLFGGSPERIIGWAPKGWNASFRDCGELRFEVPSSDRVQVWLEGFPGMASRRYETFGLGFAGSLDAILELVSARGTVTMTTVDPGKELIAYDVDWEPDA